MNCTTSIIFHKSAVQEMKANPFLLKGNFFYKNFVHVLKFSKVKFLISVVLWW